MIDYNIDNIIENCNISTVDDNYGAFDIQIRDVSDRDKDNEMYLPFLLEAINLFQKDEKEVHY